LVEGKALKLHPLACKAFNADFDGDQMAIHVPLTQAAQMECWTLMLSARNLLDPANGGTIVYPSQDMVLGIYYMTSVKPGAKGEGKRFSSADEVRMAAECGNIEWQAKIKVPAPKDSFDEGKFKKGDLIETTAGTLAFNEAMPDEVNYVNEQYGDKKLKSMIEKVYHDKGSWLTIQMLDAIKAVGYKNATFYGATLSMDDILVPKEKKDLVDKANKEVEEIVRQYSDGRITEDERYNKVTDIWQRTNEKLTDVMYEQLEKDKDGFNTIYMMAKSGARGSKKQISQLAAMRGLMAKPNGDIIELPVRSNFYEGLSVIEYFISTNGARKGLSDTALKTADAGYMTRRLVDVAQDVVINEEDCGTINGTDYAAIKDGDEIIEHLADRIEGHFTIERVVHPITGEVLCDVNSYIDENLAKKIEEAGVEKVKLRTVLTCEAKHGVCVKCYGKNLARNKVVEIGEAVGIVAAQSIGQPGTQLTLRTFHAGGAASKVTQDNNIVLKFPAIIESIEGTSVNTKEGQLFTRKGSMILTRVIESVDSKDAKLAVKDGDRVLKDTVLATSSGTEIKAKENGIVIIKDKVLYLTGADQKMEIANGSILKVKAGQVVEANAVIGTLLDAYAEPIIAEDDGYVHFEDIDDLTVESHVDEQSGVTERIISDLHLDVKQPRIHITDEDGNEFGSYYLPADAILSVEDKQKISAGDVLAKLPKAAQKSNDITGGLPRVSELFEARKSVSPSVLAQITGTVKFKDLKKGKRVIAVEDKYGHVFEHLVPISKRMLVRDGDKVEAGEPLCDGQPSPHDILAIKGENALQNYLMDEIQQVYRAQGVSINDKHIGIIVSQKLRKVEIVAVGDTRSINGQQVDKYRFREENARVIAEGGQPAIGRPMFQGISKASLSVDSFISAASFQETTRVLTNAAISGSVDALRGVKENVAIGHMIPAGTGIRNYKGVKVYDSGDQDLDIQMNEIIERRRIEKELAEAEAEREKEAATASFDNEDQD